MLRRLQIATANTTCMLSIYCRGHVNSDVSVRAQFAITIPVRWRHLLENCRIKIASKNRNCGDAKFFLIFCRKEQRTNAKSEWSKGRGLAMCRRRKNYAMIGVELRSCG